MTRKVPAEWWIEEPANTLMNVLNKPLDSARFVGGCVRNTILKLPISDMDVATKHRPEEVIGLLEDSGINVKATGLSHGTVTAFLSGVRFEITTLRRDIKTDGRHAVVQYTDCWQEDAKRRDFTINTLLMDQFGKIIDPLNCKQDILDGRVIFVGCPSQRIKEDALRILRFYRFNAYFGFGSASAVSLINQYDNLLITRSFSKSHALAGLRVGYALAHANLVEGLRRVKDSFNSYPVDAYAQCVATAAVSDSAWFAAASATVKENRAELTVGLTQLGFSVLPSEANFVLASHPEHTGVAFTEYLKSQNILVRSWSSDDLLPWVRITVGTKDEQARLLSALAEYLNG